MMAGTITFDEMRPQPLRQRVRPAISQRADFPVIAANAALLIVDIQSYLSCPDVNVDAQSQAFLYHASLPSAISKIQCLVDAFRSVRDNRKEDNGCEFATPCEVIWTYLQASTRDGRDISLDYKLSGPKLAHIPTIDTPYAQLFLSECHPEPHQGKGDILVPKTSCSVFQSTNLDYILRNLHVEQLVVCGQLTEQCVESAVRDAADLGYLVTVVPDACAAKSKEAHERGLQNMTGFCRNINTTHVLQELVRNDPDVAGKATSQEPGEVGVRLPTDDAVMEYLQSKGMHDVACDLQLRLEQSKCNHMYSERDTAIMPNRE